MAAPAWPCSLRLCSARAAKVLGPCSCQPAGGAACLAPGGSRECGCPADIVAFYYFCNFSLSFLFQSEEKIKKILKTHNEIKCNSCYIHTSGGSGGFGIFWVFAGRGMEGVE